MAAGGMGMVRNGDEGSEGEIVNCFAWEGRKGGLVGWLLG